MDEEVSDRVIEQRLRNRVIDAVEVLARGNEGHKQSQIEGLLPWNYASL
jgi:hypothetical protein